MGGEDGTNNASFAYERVRPAPAGEVKNHYWVGSSNGDGGCGGVGSLGASEGFRTYKRRKKMVGSSAESMYERDSIEGSANKSAERNFKEPEDYFLRNHASMNGSINGSSQQWRIFLLQLMYQSLKDDEGGIKGCIQDALMMTESDSHDRNRCKMSSLTAWMQKGDSFAVKDSFMCNGDLGTQNSTVTDMCRHAFLNIILSEKFTLLCKLFFENFQGMKAENLFGLSLIDRRMKEGAYEHSPLLFSSDIQQPWRELQKIGTDLVSLSKSLLDVSRICFNEQAGDLMHWTNKDVKPEFCYQKSDSPGKPEQIEACDVHQVRACRRCGGKADTRECLVCDSCEEMYHVFCIEPAIREIPPSWYCVGCTASGFGTESPHKNCVVCERLNASRAQLSQSRWNIPPTVEETLNEFEETSSYSMHDKVEQILGSTVGSCKFCGLEVEDGEEIKICDHSSCAYKYFHVRCLTRKQLKSYGPRWYCPSCLCRTCLTDRDDNKIILCDSCDNAYHIYCLSPPLMSIPRGNWFCRQCELNLQIICRAKQAYEELELKRKTEQDSDKGRGGMDVLLSAALKCEEGLLPANQTKS